MDERQRKEIRDFFGESVLFDCPMSRYTTFRVGGNAEAFCTCNDLSHLEWLFPFLRRERIPYFVMGRGSNLLVRDTGFKGVVMRLGGALSAIDEEISDPARFSAGGGAALSDVLSRCRDKGFSGLEFLVGVPGTLGGAVAMNAGAWGKQTGEPVREVLVMGPEGKLQTMDRSQLGFGYRSLSLANGSMIVRVGLGLVQDEPKAVSARMTELLAKRKSGQPLEYPSAGSVFKNPPGDFAGRLIEEAGLKGERLGGAMISPKHANFIVNTGKASAEDILGLMELARRRVQERAGVVLETEIRVMG